MISRTQVAKQVAIAITEDRPAAVAKAAAWLITHKKSNQANYLVRDIAWQLEKRGYVYVRVTSAHPLSTDSKHKLQQFVIHELNAKNVEIDEQIDSTVIGGLKIETPSGTLNNTVHNQLATLVREAQTNE